MGQILWIYLELAIQNRTKQIKYKYNEIECVLLEWNKNVSLNILY